MNLVRKIKKVLIFKCLTTRILSDKWYYRYCYFVLFGERLSFKNPVGLNAKIQWLKVYNRNPVLVQLADKYEVRSYVSEKIGAQYLVPLVGLFSRVEEIKWELLPNRFAMKATHASGWNLICNSKEELNKKRSLLKINRWLNNSFYKKEKEWQYKHIVPRVICEEYIDDNDGKVLEVKLFCYHGKPHFIIAYNLSSQKRTIYNTDWEELDGETIFKKGNTIDKPDNLRLILELAAKLSSEFVFVRVDFLVVGEQIYFGELTFTPARGFLAFNPKSLDIVFGEPLNLPAIC